MNIDGKILDMLIKSAPTPIWWEMISDLIKAGKEEKIDPDKLWDAVEHIIVDRAAAIVDHRIADDPEMLKLKAEVETIHQALQEEKTQDSLIQKCRRIIDDRKENK